MKKFDNIIIGFGKGGKTLATALSSKGQSVALIEKSAKMYGGTCINVACIPTKALEHSARLSQTQGGSFEAKALRYQTAIQEKDKLTSMLREKNYQKVISSGAEVFTGTASFIDPHVIEVSCEDGTRQKLYGEKIFINTGARSFVPPIHGLEESAYAYTSDTLMERQELPERLVIIGGGYIGLEFSSYFCNFGSKVTVIQDGEAFIPREDQEIAQSVYESMTSRGIQILKETQVMAVEDKYNHAVLKLQVKGRPEEIQADAVLIATGRRPNLEGLNLEASGIELTERGGIKVDETLQTSQPHIWAMGDVVGGLQFTYISLDDFRITLDQIAGKKNRTTANRGKVPYSVFIDPPISRVGMTEEEAKKAGYKIQVAKLPAAAIPKAHILKKTDGLLKVIMDQTTHEILGAHFFCAQSQEMINIMKLAMDARLPYETLRDAIYTHPTMSEGLNDLLQSL